MSGQTNQKERREFAVAVRDGSDLFLFLRISRAPKGDVYVFFPRDYEPKWTPHSSYHASGQHHQKSFNQKMGRANLRQKPDANFSGTENVVTIGISPEELSSVDNPCHCQAGNFHEVFEIPVSELKTERYRTFVSVDVSDSRGEPIITPGASVLRQATFTDEVPWILATLFETG